MTEETNIAVRYRQFFEELRVIADDTKNRLTTRVLLDIAIDYERKASSMDAIDRTNKHLEARLGRENEESPQRGRHGLSTGG